MNNAQNLQQLFDEFVKTELIPQHKCKQHLRIIEETHSLNSFHNIVVARRCVCKICGKNFEYYDPRGLD